MSTATETRPSSTESTGDDNEPDHLYCCDENRGLCGTDLTDVAEKADIADDDLCVVCAYLIDAPCAVTCHSRTT